MQQILSGFISLYEQSLTRLFCQKLGLTFSEETVKEDKKLMTDLFQVMYSNGADFTQTFRDLSEISFKDLLENRDKMCGAVHWGLAKVRKAKEFEDFLSEYSRRLKEEFGQEAFEEVRMERMQSANPRYILRNWYNFRIFVSKLLNVHGKHGRSHILYFSNRNNPFRSV